MMIFYYYYYYVVLINLYSNLLISPVVSHGLTLLFFMLNHDCCYYCYYYLVIFNILPHMYQITKPILSFTINYRLEFFLKIIWLQNLMQIFLIYAILIHFLYLLTAMLNLQLSRVDNYVSFNKILHLLTIYHILLYIVFSLIFVVPYILDYLRMI